MVATVGSIAIDLVTNVAKFIAGFKSAATTVERESSRMAKSIGGIERTLANFGKGLLAGVGIGTLTKFIDGAREAIAKLDDVADRAASSGVGTDLLQGLEQGARQAGIEVDALSGGLQFFAKGMGQAAEGTGRLYAGLLKLNPVLLQSILNAKDQETRLKLVADALAKTRDATERAALSAALFGDVDFARLFGGGAAAIDQMVQALDGKLFTAEQIARASEYDAKLNDLSKSIENNLTKAFVNAGPAIVYATEQLDKFIESTAKGVEGIPIVVDRLGQALDAIGAGFTRDFEAELKGIERTIRTLQAQIANTPVNVDTTDAERTLAKLQAQAAQLRAQVTAEMEVNVDTTAAQAAISALGGAMAELSRQAVRAASGGTLPTVHRGSGVDSDVMDKVEDAINKGTEATNRTTRAIDSLRSSSGGGGGPLTYSVPAGGGYATGSAATSFGFSGGGRDSWSGRQMSFSTGTPAPGRMGDAARANFMEDRFNYGWRGADTAGAAAAGGVNVGGDINVVVNLPQMIGTLSGSAPSRAAIEQASRDGVLAALRDIRGRG